MTVLDNENAGDGMPYMILGYAQGKGFYANLAGNSNNVTRSDPSDLNVTNFQYNYPGSGWMLAILFPRIWINL